MTHPSSPPAPMTAGKLKSLRETTEGNIRSRALRGLAPGSYATDIALLDHIDALTARVATLEAELAAARKIEDKEVSEFIDWLRLEQNEPGISAGLAWRYERTQQLLSALSAALKEAERELQSLQETTGGILTRAALIARADAAEARAQAAEATLETIRLALFPDPEHHITHHARYNLEGALADLEAGQNDPTVRRTLQRVAGQIAAAEHALQTKDTTP